MTRTTVRWAAALAATLTAVVLVSSPAHAAAYRYWTYWQGPAGAWAFATQGPGTSVPADGDVEGWAFAVSTESANADDAPATPPDFAAICGSTPAQPETKRVALVIDTGAPGLAPEGDSPPAPVTTCVVIAPDATGYDVLRSVATVRTEDGLVCGIADYPASECAAVLDDAEAAALLARHASTDAAPTTVPSPAPSLTGMPADRDGGGSGSPLATIAVAALLIIAAGLGWRRFRGAR